MCLVNLPVESKAHSRPYSQCGPIGSSRPEADVQRGVEGPRAAFRARPLSNERLDSSFLSELEKEQAGKHKVMRGTLG